MLNIYIFYPDPSEDPAAVALLQSLKITKEQIRGLIMEHFCPGEGNRPDTCSCPDNSVHPFPDKPIP
jgi:hypothetical protein